MKVDNMQLSSRKFMIGLSLLAGMAFVNAACSRVEQPAPAVAGDNIPAATVAPQPESIPQPVATDTAPATTVAPPLEPMPPPTLTPPASTPPASTSAPFGSAQTLRIGKSAAFADGLTVELNKIDDSRCAANVQCIWAGQLAPEFTLQGGDLQAAKTISLGTVQTKTQTVAPYTVTLIDASSDSATLSVTKDTGAARAP